MNKLFSNGCKLKEELTVNQDYKNPLNIIFTELQIIDEVLCGDCMASNANKKYTGFGRSSSKFWLRSYIQEYSFIHSGRPSYGLHDSHLIMLIVFQ